MKFYLCYIRGRCLGNTRGASKVKEPFLQRQAKPMGNRKGEEKLLFTVHPNVINQ